MAAKKVDQDKADDGAASPRHIGAYFLGGRWLAADGSPLTDKESQQAHRAADRAAAEAKRRALLGGGV